MDHPRLYAWYDREQAVAFFGGEPKAQRLCDGQWLIFPEAAVCLTTIGAPPRLSHFSNGSTFSWVADKPYHVHADKYNHFVPEQVIGSEAKGRSLHLCVRPKGSEKYQYLGELGPSHMQQAPGSENHGMARFDLHRTLPSTVWAKLGGLHMGNTDTASVDQALDRLRGPTTVQDRLEILRALVEYWHGPVIPEDGIPDAQLASFRLPRPLRWWYRWAGRRTKIMSGQNTLFDPTGNNRPKWEPRTEEDLFLFYVENQWVYQWATQFDGDDPPVFGRYDPDDDWEPEGVNLSEHLILACIFEAVLCHSPYGASAASLEGRVLSRIAEVIPPIAINPWHWVGPTRFHARNGAFMVSMPIGDDVYSIFIGAKTEGPLQFLKPYLGDEWDYRAV